MPLSRTVLEVRPLVVLGHMDTALENGRRVTVGAEISSRR